MKTSFHVSDADLTRALAEQPTDTPFAEIETHIARCEQCQLRLLDLSAGSRLRNQFADRLNNCSWSSAFNLESAGVSSPNPADDFEGQQPTGNSFDLKTVKQMLTEMLLPPTCDGSIGRLGRYDVVKLLGCGGMGAVLRGFDRDLNRPVAIKMMLPRLASNGTAKFRFLREAKAAGTVVHPNVIEIHDINETNGVPWFVMPLVIGPTMRELVENNGPMTERDIVYVGIQLAGGLAAAHAKGLVHRDVTPENVLVDPHTNRVVLTDFGLARCESEGALTQTGMLLGTLQYMSPEQSRGDAIDGRSDLFSLGSVLYFLTTGRPPFPSTVSMKVLDKIRNQRHIDVRRLNPDASKHLASVIDRLLEKKPANRFSSASELESYLADYLAHVNCPTRLSAPRIPAKRLTSGRAVFLMLSFSAVCAALGCIPWIASTGWASYSHRSASERTTVPQATDKPNLKEQLPDIDATRAEIDALKQKVSEMQEIIGDY